MAAAKVTTDSRADAVLEGSEVSRGQWAHQVTGAVLHILQQTAFQLYQESILQPPEGSLDLRDWCKQLIQKHPQFH